MEEVEGGEVVEIGVVDVDEVEEEAMVMVELTKTEEAEGWVVGVTGVVEVEVVVGENTVVDLVFSARRRHLPYRSQIGLGRLGDLGAGGRARGLVVVGVGIEVVGGVVVVVVSIVVVEEVGVEDVGERVVVAVVFVVVVEGVVWTEEWLP